MIDPKAMRIFGIEQTSKEPKLIFLPVPWEATTSYGGGTSRGPEAILRASQQKDETHSDVQGVFKYPMQMLKISENVLSWNNRAKELAAPIKEVEGRIGESLRGQLNEVNELSLRLNDWVYDESRKILAEDKYLGVLGGDHSVPFGAFRAIAERESSFGILHIDAHHDLRIAYEGFEHSHASIMYNALESIPEITRLHSVGIRDYCEQEREYAASQKDRVRIFYDAELQERRFQGENWDSISRQIISGLPEKVWISFDIDGLDPRYCPSTGTPVPGGLDFAEAVHLFKLLSLGGKKIIGFDLCEVAPSTTNEWDANVGMRLLWELTAWMLATQGELSTRE